MKTHRIAFVIPSLLAVLSFAAAAHAAVPGDLIKLACPAFAPADHPCRAVYYWGGDGVRHAFPNAKIYSTWFKDFSGVRTVAAEAMASIRLGRNVTYRPGARLVKLTTADDVYAVDADAVLRPIASEQVAAQTFGAAWNKGIDDLPDAFFADYSVGQPIRSASDFDSAARLAATPTLDAAWGASYASRTVVTPVGTFSARVVTLDRAKYRMKTLVTGTGDCSDGCPVASLADQAARVGAMIGMNGTYFCPPEYADCAGKTNSFLWPVFDSPTATMRNAGSIQFHHGPLLASGARGDLRFYRDARTFSEGGFLADTGTAVDAAIANYPALVDGGSDVAASEPMLDNGQRTIKGTRGGLGFSDGRIFLVIAQDATVLDLAEIMKTLGATYAMNLDGGGSAALLYGGTYMAGPGRLLPNVVTFVRATP